MGHAIPYVKLSDIFSRTSVSSSSADLRSCDRALGLFEEALFSIDAMSNDEREIFIKSLTAWMITDKFGPHARPAIHGLQKFSIADCLLENPFWEPRVVVSDASL